MNGGRAAESNNTALLTVYNEIIVGLWAIITR